MDAYGCAITGGQLGAYDSVGRWTLRSSGLGRNDQAMVSVHERLHHDLQHTTPWGLIARTARELADLGVEPDRFGRLFRFCREAAREVHEVYATSLSLAGHPEAHGFLDESPDYRAYLRSGLLLAGPEPWDTGRFVADALLRGCMAPEALNHLFRRGLRGLRISDLDTALVRPDARLAAVLSAALAVEAPHESEAPGTTGELADYFTEVAGVMNRGGVATLDGAGVSAFIEHLFEDIAELSPDLRRRMEVDETRSPVSDDIEEHAREQIELSVAGPPRVELIPLAETAHRALELVQVHREAGVHRVVAWMRSRLLAGLFARPNPFEEREGHVVALLSPYPDESVVRMADFGLDDPGPVMEAFDGPAICLTTATCLFAAPATADPARIGRIFAFVDTGDLPAVVEAFGPTARLAWNRGQLNSRKLTIFLLGADVLPGIIWFHITGVAGRSYVSRWLESLGEEKARRSPESFAGMAAEIDIAVGTVLACWPHLGPPGPPGPFGASGPSDTTELPSRKAGV